jgi:ABC-type Fe3+/spermidine/putrescine transport system ATPase subunit
MRQGRVEQYASPHELYERPANRFVASFAGAANFIPARISTLGARDITVDAFREFSVAYPQAGPAPSGGPGSIGQTRLGGWSATSVRNRWSGPRLREGEQVTVMVRPNKLKRARLGARNAFEATVSSRQYFAHYYEYRCRCDGLAFTLFDPAEYAVGETLRLTFDPEDAVLLDE